MQDVEVINKCRLCGSDNLEDVFNFGSNSLANSYLTKEEVEQVESGMLQEFQCDLTYCFCKDCFGIQERHIIDPNILFGNYLYASSTSGNLLNYFKNYCDDLIERFKLDKDDFVVVIASNDGVELKNFVEKEIPALGVEPAKNLAELANKNGHLTINKFFGEETAKEIVNKYGKASCIVFNNCFAHLSDYDDFAAGLNILLKEDGFGVLENSYLVPVIKNNLLDVYYHEHSVEWGLSSLTNFLHKHELEPFDFIETSPHGGSFRCFIQHEWGPRAITKNVYNVIENECFNYKLHKVETYKNWFNSLNKIKENVQEFIRDEQKKGKTFSAFGYPAKANTLCSFLGIGNIFEYIVEDSGFKIGKFTPNFHIPIYSKQKLKENPTDYCLVLAWNFYDLIVKNNNYYKGDWINPFKI